MQTPLAIPHFFYSVSEERVPARRRWQAEGPPEPSIPLKALPESPSPFSSLGREAGRQAVKSASSQGIWTRAPSSTPPHPCRPVVSHRLGFHLLTDSLLVTP